MMMRAGARNREQARLPSMMAQQMLNSTRKGRMMRTCPKASREAG